MQRGIVLANPPGPRVIPLELLLQADQRPARRARSGAAVQALAGDPVVRSTPTHRTLQQLLDNALERISRLEPMDAFAATSSGARS